MAYEKQNFADGFPLAAAQLNHIEDGIEELEKQMSSGGNAEDGFSPIATVEQTSTGAVVSITDKTGTTTATITNGKDGEDGKDGADGKSAYQYAKDGGYTGTEAEFAEKLASESSGIHVGASEPTDGSTVWIDTDEEAEEPPAGKDGIGIIDITISEVK